MDIRDLDERETGRPDFRRLLWLSVEVDGDPLERIRVDILPTLTVIGAEDAGELVGFAAYQCGNELTSAVTIRYVATAENRHGSGLGTSLIRELRRRHPSSTIQAQTDDDAIGFYRRIGFETVPAPRDPRWPDRQRYDCTLLPSPAPPPLRSGRSGPGPANSVG